jgi:hypothetical protein
MTLMRSLLLLACLVWGAAQAQVSLEVNVPEGSALRISQAQLGLDLERVAFPPLAFPAYFEVTDPAEPITIELFSSIAGGWKLRVEFAGLESEEGNLLLPSQIVYRLNGAGDWLPLGPSVTLLTGQGVSTAYERHTLELRLKLLGNERPGAYEGALVFSLAPL